MRRRERATIIGEILDALADIDASGQHVPMTRVALRVNLPYDRFTTYVRDLQSHGVVGSSSSRRLTPKGEQLLERYRAWTQALRGSGLQPRKPRQTHES